MDQINLRKFNKFCLLGGWLKWKGHCAQPIFYNHIWRAAHSSNAWQKIKENASRFLLHVMTATCILDLKGGPENLYTDTQSLAFFIPLRKYLVLTTKHQVFQRMSCLHTGNLDCHKMLSRIKIWSPSVFFFLIEMYIIYKKNHLSRQFFLSPFH